MFECYFQNQVVQKESSENNSFPSWDPPKPQTPPVPSSFKYVISFPSYLFIFNGVFLTTC